MADHETKTRLLTKIAWELLKEQSFEDLADFAAVLKLRLGRLKITWEAHEVSDVIARISSHSEILTDPFNGLEHVKGHEIIEESQAIPPGEASQIYHGLMNRYRDEHPKVETVNLPGQPENFPNLVMVPQWK